MFDSTPLKETSYRPKHRVRSSDSRALPGRLQEPQSLYVLPRDGVRRYGPDSLPAGACHSSHFPAGRVTFPVFPAIQREAPQASQKRDPSKFSVLHLSQMIINSGRRLKILPHAKYLNAKPQGAHNALWHVATAENLRETDAPPLQTARILGDFGCLSRFVYNSVCSRISMKPGVVVLRKTSLAVNYSGALASNPGQSP